MTKFLAFFSCALFILAGGGCGKTESVATLKILQGKVDMRESASSPFRPAKDQEPLAERSAVRTGPDGQARLTFPGKGDLAIDRDTFFEVRKGDILGLQDSGRVTYKIEKQGGKTISVETPHGVTTVLGTQFLLDVSATGTSVVVNEGSVRFVGKSGISENLSAGQTSGSDGTTVSKPTTMSIDQLEAIFSTSKKILINPH